MTPEAPFSCLTTMGITFAQLAGYPQQRTVRQSYSCSPSIYMALNHKVKQFIST